MKSVNAHLQLLPSCGLTLDGIPVKLGTRGQRLLTRIGLCDGLPMRRRQLAGELWPDSTASRATANLRSTISTLRRCAPVLDLVEDTVSLAPSVVVDWRVAVDFATTIVAGHAIAGPERALDLLRHRLLPAWSEPWLEVEQLRFDDLRLHALERLSEDLSSRGEHAFAVQAGIAAIRDEPFRESAHRALAKAYLAEGNRVAAVRQYDRFAVVLGEELGVPPSEQFTRLVRADALPALTGSGAERVS